MLLNLIKFALFVIVNVFGFYVVPLITNTAIKFYWMPDQLTLVQQDMMMRLFAGFVVPWGIAALASIGFFLTRGEMRAWLILAPLYVPAIYGFGILAYFHIV